MVIREISKRRFKIKDMKDKCVLCGEETPYLMTENINNRHFYIEGAGQLCKDCHDKTYS